MINNKCECGCGQLVKKENNKFIHGHNLKNPLIQKLATLGRIGKKHSIEWIKKIRDKNIGKKRTVEQRNKISKGLKGRISPNKGKKLSLEHREQLSLAHKKRWQNPEIRNMYSLVHLGNKQTKETKKKISLKLKENWNKLSDIEKIEYWNKGNRSKKGYGKFGYFWSIKNNKQLYYRSFLELFAYQILESMSKVIKYEIEPFGIDYYWNGSVHKYYVDIKILYNDGHIDLIEIKPNFRLKNERENLKIEYGKKYAIENNMGFQIWTEKDIYVNKNLA